MRPTKAAKRQVTSYIWEASLRTKIHKYLFVRDTTKHYVEKCIVAFGIAGIMNFGQTYFGGGTARQFFRTYPIANTLRSQLNWSQYRKLIQISDPNKREYYELESVNVRNLKIRKTGMFGASLRLI